MKNKGWCSSFFKQMYLEMFSKLGRVPLRKKNNPTILLSPWCTTIAADLGWIYYNLCLRKPEAEFGPMNPATSTDEIYRYKEVTLMRTFVHQRLMNLIELGYLQILILYQLQFLPKISHKTWYNFCFSLRWSEETKAVAHDNLGSCNIIQCLTLSGSSYYTSNSCQKHLGDFLECTNRNFSSTFFKGNRNKN